MRMWHLGWIVAAFALALVVAQPALAEDKGKAADQGNKADRAKNEQSHEGKVVRVSEGQLTMTDKSGGNQHTHMISKDAKITCDGKECKLEDLKAGYFVKVTTKGDADRTVVRVEAKKSAVRE